MSDLTLEGHFSKSYVHKNLGRARRTLTVDITGAVARRDTDLLKLLRLKTNDGRIREGTEIEPDTVNRLEKDGNAPRWYVHPQFVQEVRKRSSRSREHTNEESRAVLESAEMPDRAASDSSQQPPDPDTAADETTSAAEILSAQEVFDSLPKDPQTRLAVLEHLVVEKQRQIVSLNEKYKDVRDDRQEDRELQKEIQGTLKAITEKLEPGGLKIVPMTTSEFGERSSAPKPATTRKQEQASIVDAEVVKSQAAEARPPL